MSAMEDHGNEMEAEEDSEYWPKWRKEEVARKWSRTMWNGGYLVDTCLKIDLLEEKGMLVASLTIKLLAWHTWSELHNNKDTMYK